LLSDQKIAIQGLIGKRNLIMEAAKRREEARLWFDHYRIKTAELREKESKAKGGLSCGPSGDRDRVIRNMDKLAKSETEFKMENNNVDKLVKDIHQCANSILNELTIRFTV